MSAGFCAVLRRKSVLVLGAIACLVVAGCDNVTPLRSSGTATAPRPSTSGAPATTTTPTPTRSTIALRVSNKKVVGPRTVQPGLAHLRNAGKESIYVYRSRGSGLSAFVRGYNSSSSEDLSAKFTAVAHFFTGIDVWVSLTPGTYYVANGSADKIERSQVLTMNVAGARADSAAPTGVQAVTIARDETLSAPTTLSTRRPLRVATSSDKSEVLYALRVGTTSNEKIAAFVKNPTKQRNFKALKAKEEVQVLFVDGPAVVYTTWRAKPGTYVLSNLAYEIDGTSRLERGQARQVTITG